MGLEAETPDMSSCHRCGRPLGMGESGRLVFLFKWAASMSMAMVHGGIWLWEELSMPYCARCRRWLSFLCVVLVAIVLSVAFLGIRWVLKLRPA